MQTRLAPSSDVQSRTMSESLAISSEFLAFLATVDATAKKRSKDFIQRAATAFHMNEARIVVCACHVRFLAPCVQIECESDLIGADASRCGSFPSEGIAAFMSRAIQLAERKFKLSLVHTVVDVDAVGGGAPAPSGGTARSEIASLVQSVRNEDAKVHISLEAPIKVRHVVHR